MKFVSSLAIAASLIVGGVAAAPAVAQDKAAKAPERKFKLSKEAQNAIAALQKSLTEKAADFPEKLAAAQAVAKNTDDKYVIAKFQLQRASEENNKDAQRAAVEAILASGGADASETTQLQTYLAGNAIESGDYGAAETFYAQKIAANPNDLDSVVNLARAKIELKKEAEALTLLQKAISMSKASGQKPPEAWYRNALGIAYKQKNTALSNQLATEVQQAYPSPENFKNLVSISVPAIAKDEEAYVDLMRLMQDSGSLETGEYLRLAEYLDYNRNWGEAKAVLEAAAKSGKSGAGHAALLTKVNSRVAEDKAALPGVEPKARSAANGQLAANLAGIYAGYGDYTKAAELYRLALQKGGVDANLVNTRLGIALARGGNRAEAETAFKAVTGLRSQVANLWMAWLAQRG
ncbi:tetratricopeptide repeat protein [Sphingosinicella sp. BN140058]|uniref:tetratricopeptide repeat protein n=1 Tax=Sphingosinicella sp. BN140058 TaxID=1892855 RepID=UPI001011159A|nr:tetratricopeptide repeat protein [Sphingosinicella sp. BN140058]QAY79282.1 tetratricopeptide repeat protein [Sphingosinicella sp. BN140058]